VENEQDLICKSLSTERETVRNPVAAAAAAATTVVAATATVVAAAAAAAAVAVAGVIAFMVS